MTVHKTNDHYTNLGLASIKFIQCQTLFEAIISTARSDQPELRIVSLVENIAEIGNDISAQWSEHFGDQREGLGQGGAK